MSNVIYYLLLLMTVALNASGGVMMKVGSKHVAFGSGEGLLKTGLSMVTNWQLVLGVFLYGLSFVTSTLVYTKVSLNIAYPILVGSSFLLISVASLIFFSEKFTVIQIVGSILLLVGIFMISLNLKSS